MHSESLNKEMCCGEHILHMYRTEFTLLSFKGTLFEVQIFLLV